MFDEKVMNDNSDGVVDHQDDRAFETEEFDDVEIDNETEIDEDIEDSDVDDVGEVDSDTGENEETEEPQQKKQSPEQNAQFKKMRLKAEQEARAKIEAELAEEKQRLQQLRIQTEQQLAEKRIVDEHMNPEKVAELAYNEGVSEDVARRILQAETQRIIDAEKMKVKERFDHLQSQKKELQKDKYFRLLEKEVDDIVNQNPNVDYKAVYYYQRGLKSDELEQKLASNVEKRTIANLQDRARRKNISSSDGALDSTPELSDFGKEFAVMMGVDPREASKIISKRNDTRKRRNR